MQKISRLCLSCGVACLLFARLGALTFPLSGSWWLSGEALLLRPTVANNYFGVIGPQILDVNPVGPTTTFVGPQGRQLTLSAGYAWGYEIDFGYHCCCTDLRASWESFINVFRRTIRAASDEVMWFSLALPNVETEAVGVVHPPLAVGGIARAMDGHRFQAITADAGYSFSRGTRLSGCAFAGVRHARFRVDRVVDYLSATEILEIAVAQFSDTQGTGPRVGLSGEWRLFPSLSLTGEVASSLLIGTTRGFFGSFDQDVGFFDNVPHGGSLRNESGTAITPEMFLRFGVSAQGYVGFGLFLWGSVGYQIDHFFSGVQRTQLVSNQNLYEIIQIQEIAPLPAANNPMTTGPYTLDGWVFRLGARY